MRKEEGAPKRFWVRHKTQAILRLLRGDDIDLVSRELGVTAATLSQWRDTFLEAEETGLKPQSTKEPVEVGRLREKIGEQALENELLREKIARLEQNRPWARGGRENEPSRLGLHGEELRAGAGLPCLGAPSFHGILEMSARGRGCSSQTTRPSRRA